MDEKTQWSGRKLKLVGCLGMELAQAVRQLSRTLEAAHRLAHGISIELLRIDCPRWDTEGTLNTFNEVTGVSASTHAYRLATGNADAPGLAEIAGAIPRCYLPHFAKKIGDDYAAKRRSVFQDFNRNFSQLRFPPALYVPKDQWQLRQDATGTYLFSVPIRQCFQLGGEDLEKPLVEHVTFVLATNDRDSTTTNRKGQLAWLTQAINAKAKLDAVEATAHTEKWPPEKLDRARGEAIGDSRYVKSVTLTAELLPLTDALKKFGVPSYTRQNGKSCYLHPVINLAFGSRGEDIGALHGMCLIHTDREHFLTLRTRGGKPWYLNKLHYQRILANQPGHGHSAEQFREQLDCHDAAVQGLREDSKRQDRGARSKMHAIAESFDKTRADFVRKTARDCADFAVKSRHFKYVVYLDTETTFMPHFPYARLAQALAHAVGGYRGSEFIHYTQELPYVGVEPGKRPKKGQVCAIDYDALFDQLHREHCNGSEAAAADRRAHHNLSSVLKLS